MIADPWCEASEHGTRREYQRAGCRCTAARADIAAANRRRVEAHARGEKPPYALVDAAGTRRRLRALATAGWSLQDLSARLYQPEQLISRWRSGRAKLVTARNAEAVRAVYDEINLEQGPSALATSRALAKGWPAPIELDDRTIDSPRTRRVKIDTRKSDRGSVHLDDLEVLVESGQSWHTIATQLRVKVDSIYRACERAGRDDLLDRLRLPKRSGNQRQETEAA